MASFEGRWKAVMRQATFGVTPVRKVSSGDIADLVIEPNGQGHSYRKGVFSQKELPFDRVPKVGVTAISREG